MGGGRAQVPRRSPARLCGPRRGAGINTLRGDFGSGALRQWEGGPRGLARTPLAEPLPRGGAGGRAAPLSAAQGAGGRGAAGGARCTEPVARVRSGAGSQTPFPSAPFRPPRHFLLSRELRNNRCERGWGFAASCSRGLPSAGAERRWRSEAAPGGPAGRSAARRDPRAVRAAVQRGRQRPRNGAGSAGAGSAAHPRGGVSAPPALGCSGADTGGA